MSITGKLHVDGKAYSVLDYRMSFRQQKDITGKPTGRVHGGLIHVTIEAMMDTVFHHWATAPEMMKDTEIVFSPVTRVSKSRTIKLYDVYLARISTHFTSQTSAPMTFTLVFSPGIFVDQDVVYKKPWHVTDLETQNVAPTLAPEEEFDEQLKALDQYGNPLVGLWYCIVLNKDVVLSGQTDQEGLTERIPASTEQKNFECFWGDEALAKIG